MAPNIGILDLPQCQEDFFAAFTGHNVFDSMMLRFF